VTTLAGTANRAGAADGTGAAASFSLPYGITVDPSGNLYVTDGNNSAIRKVTPAGVVTTIAGTAGQAGNVDGNGTAARFNLPTGIARDPAGNLFVVDVLARTVRKIDTAGNVTTVAGVADGVAGVRAGALPGHFSTPVQIAIDAAGRLYVTDANAVLQIVLP
jgi:secreted PhoX family phosphatase